MESFTMSTSLQNRSSATTNKSHILQDRKNMPAFQENMYPILQPDSVACKEKTQQKTMTSTKKRTKKHSKKTLARITLMRDRERCALESLQLDVNGLKQTIIDLNTRQHLLQGLQSFKLQQMDTNMVQVMVEYTRVFRHGFMFHLDKKSQHHIQEDFLKTVMSQDAAFGLLRGPMSLINQWQRYTKYHESIYVTSPAVEIQGTIDNPIIVADFVLNCRLNRKSIQNIFPHILHDEDLVQQLIGKVAPYATHAQAFFDHQGKIVRFDIQVDFLQGLYSILKDLTQVHKLLEHARIKDSVNLQDSSFSRIEEIVEKDDDNTTASCSKSSQSSSYKASIEYLLS